MCVWARFSVQKYRPGFGIEKKIGARLCRSDVLKAGARGCKSFYCFNPNRVLSVDTSEDVKNGLSHTHPRSSLVRLCEIHLYVNTELTGIRRQDIRMCLIK